MILFFNRDLDVPGSFVRISRRQQNAIDAENARKIAVIRKRGKKRRISSQPEEHNDPIPSSMYVNASMLRHEITRHVDDVVALWSAQEAQMRLDRLEGIWQKISEFWDSLGSMAMTFAASNLCVEFCSQIWDEYLPYKVKLQLLIEQARMRTHNGTSAMSVNAGGQLIQIQLSEPPKLPKFSGLEIDWANFRAIFEAEVHKNPRFSKTQKMRHLLGALQGRAAAAYASWPIMGETSYDLLWTDMCTKYSNEYNTIRAHLQAIKSLVPMQKPTSDAMRKIIDVSRGSFRQLQLLLKPEEMAEYMLMFQIEGLLDAESQIQWALRRSTDALPTLEQLFNFLELRASMLGNSLSSAPAVSSVQSNALSRGSQLSAQRGIGVGRSDEQRPSCDLCPGQMHWPFKCIKFKSKTFDERTDYVSQRQMCHNCFSMKHKTKQCPDSGCYKCKTLHNSCLCPQNKSIGPLDRTNREAEARRGDMARKATVAGLSSQ